MSGRGLASYLQALANDLAFKDDLTGLYNRRLLSHSFTSWWDELGGEDRLFSLLMLDLDGFKKVNDTHGHLVGDCVLQRTAEALRRTFRSNDVVVRYGGDEFVVLLPGTGQSEAESLGKRAREALATLLGTVLGESCAVPFEVSFSLGTATFAEDGTSGEELLARADERLYLEKRRSLYWRKGKPRRFQLLLAAGGTVVAVIVAALLWLRPTPLSTPSVVPGSPRALAGSGPSPRELALLEEIARLRTELERREIKSAPRTPAEGREDNLQELRQRIDALERQLANERLALIEPTPIPSPADVSQASTREVLPEATASPSVPLRAESQQAVAPSYVPPRLLRYDAPVYPERARQFRRQAVVELRVKVDATGKVTGAWPIGTPIGLGFEESARRAALTAQYMPALLDGTPVEAETTLTVVFRLAGM